MVSVYYLRGGGADTARAHRPAVQQRCYDRRIPVRPAEWLDQIPVTVVAKAITDRLCTQAYKIIMRDKKSMRETTHL